MPWKKRKVKGYKVNGVVGERPRLLWREKVVRKASDPLIWNGHLKKAPDEVWP